MKKHLFLKIAFFVVAIQLTACNKFTKFKIEYDDAGIIKADLPIGTPFNLNTPATNTNSTAIFESNDTRKDYIESIKLEELYLSIESPSGKTFSFLNEIHIFIKADGLDEKEIAYKSNIPASVGATMSLDIPDVELQEYIKKDSYTLRINASKDELLTSDVSIKLHSKFAVDAKILGI